MPQPNTITIDKTEYVRKDSVKTTTYKPSKKGPWLIGRSYYVLTVTMGVHGVLVEVCDQELVLIDAAWIADTNRFHDFVTGKAQPKEVEPFPRNTPVKIGRGAIVFACPVEGAFEVQV